MDLCLAPPPSPVRVSSKLRFLFSILFQKVFLLSPLLPAKLIVDFKQECVEWRRQPSILSLIKAPGWIWAGRPGDGVGGRVWVRKEGVNGIRLLRCLSRAGWHSDLLKASAMCLTFVSDDSNRLFFFCNFKLHGVAFMETFKSPRFRLFCIVQAPNLPTKPYKKTVTGRDFIYCWAISGLCTSENWVIVLHL